MTQAEETEYSITSILANLNKEQKEAVALTEGPLLVLAGAGTGKTRVLTSRIAFIISAGLAKPSEILAVTFTNKAAREMENRVQQYCNSAGLWLGTFHSIAAKILRSNAHCFDLSPYFTIIDVDDQIRLIKNILTSKNVDIKANPPKIIHAIISKWKDLGLPVYKLSESDISSPYHKVARDIYPEYQKQLLDSNSVDFGDLLLYNVELFQKFPHTLSHYQNSLKYILVDEYQDTNAVQYLWLRMLADRSKNICCVGDDDQSIYSWRGAEVTNILRFEKDFKQAKIIKLEQNYRSKDFILHAAGGVIKNNSMRHGKTLWTDLKSNDKVEIVSCWNDREEARFIITDIENLLSAKQYKAEEIAILVRTGAQTRTLEETLIANALPYQMIGGLKFYERMEIRDALAYIRATVNQEDNLALERIINTPKRAIGNSTLKQIKDYANEHSLCFMAAISSMLQNGILRSKVGVTLQELTNKFASWKEKFASKEPAKVVQDILDESGYIDMWKQEKSPESTARLDNIKEMIRAISEYSTIEEFLEHTSLVMDNDSLNEGHGGVKLMTLHAAKGLEFDVVFLPGWEEGIFPHQKALTEEGYKGLEEERRIAYVGITRARHRLTISHAENRRLYNEFVTSTPSRFIAEIPQEVCKRRFSSKNLNYLGTSHSFSMNLQNKKQEATPLPGMRAGTQVLHEKFGKGIIISKNGDNIEVAFAQHGIKTIKENFLKSAS